MFLSFAPDWKEKIMIVMPQALSTHATMERPCSKRIRQLADGHQLIQGEIEMRSVSGKVFECFITLDGVGL